MLQHKCRDCGRQFEGGPRAYYCPNCRSVRKQGWSKKAKKTIGRKMGSKDYCERCGKQYTVTAPLQRFCDPCKGLHKIEYDRTRKLKYYNDNKSAINPKRNKTRVDDYANLPESAKELARQRSREWKEPRVLARIVSRQQLYNEIRDFATNGNIKNTNLTAVREDTERINTIVTVTKSENLRLRQLSKTKGIPMSAFFRLGLKVVLDYYDHIDSEASE